MADYRLSVKIISRGKGQSVVAAAAYRAGAELKDERYGYPQDYTKRRGVVHTEIVLPEGYDGDLGHDRGELWNRVEEVETHPNAQLAREIQLSLPHELPADARRGIAIAFAQYVADTYGFAVDTAIHAPSHAPGADERNHHAHLLFATRALDEGRDSGFARTKDRRFNAVAMQREGAGNEIEHLREVWEDMQNRELARWNIHDEAGQPVRVDRRSFERQGIDREPTTHEGVEATAIKRRGQLSERAAFNLQIADRNQQIDEIADRIAGHCLGIYEEAATFARTPHLKNLQWEYRDDPVMSALLGNTHALSRELRPAVRLVENALDMGDTALRGASSAAGAVGDGLVQILGVFAGFFDTAADARSQADYRQAGRAERQRAAQQVASMLDSLERVAEQKRQIGRESDLQFDDEAALKRRKTMGLQF